MLFHGEILLGMRSNRYTMIPFASSAERQPFPHCQMPASDIGRSGQNPRSRFWADELKTAGISVVQDVLIHHDEKVSENRKNTILHAYVFPRAMNIFPDFSPNFPETRFSSYIREREFGICVITQRTPRYQTGLFCSSSSHAKY